MAELGGIMTVAPTNTFVFTNSASNDVVVFTDTSNQMIRIGTMSNAPSVLNVGSNYMRLQGNVSVGSINPSYPLDVLGDINFTGNLRQNGALYVGSQWSNSGTNVFILSSNIGIGKSNPAYPLDIVGDLNFSGNLRQGGALYVGSQWSNSGNQVFILSSNIGIGLSNPSARLHIANASGTKLRFDNDITTNRHIILYDSQVTSNEHQFFGLGVNANIFRLQIDATTSRFGFYAGTSSNTSREICSLFGTSELRLNSTITGINSNSNVNSIISKNNQVLSYNNSAGGSNHYAENLVIQNNPITGSFWGGSPKIYGGDLTFQAGSISLTGNNGTAYVEGYGGNLNFLPGFAYVSSSGVGNSRYVESGETQFYYANTNGISINSNYTLALKIDKQGNVGIGTSNPSTLLDVNGAASFRGNISINNAVGIKGLTIYKRDGTMANITTSSVAGLSNDDSGIILSVGSNDTTTNFRFWGNSTEVMRLTGNGNLGIGYSNPSYKLDVNGDMRTSNIEVVGNISQNGVIFSLIGVVLPFAGSTAPNGWLLCFGQAVSRTTYSALFAIIGTTYGVGDGSTTFNIPDMRGRVVAGKDNMGGTSANRITSGVSGITATTLGAAGGDERLHAHTHSVTDPGHNHTINDPGHTHSIAIQAFMDGGSSYRSMFGNTGTTATGSSTTGITINNRTTGITIANNTQGGTAQNVQPTVILNYIIKY